jgi:hypothetical protein
MLIEIFAPWEGAFGYGPWEVFKFLIGYGYKFLFACPEGLDSLYAVAGQSFPASVCWRLQRSGLQFQSSWRPCS